MQSATREQYLRIALVVFGLIFVVGIWPMMQLWPSGWQWQPAQMEYEQMIVGVYATLGVFLLLASRNPAEHRSLILFTGWSSLVHGGIMALHALRDSGEAGHLVGDVPAVLLVGVVLILLAPRASVSGTELRVPMTNAGATPTA
jgi:hypothetical protein